MESRAVLPQFGYVVLVFGAMIPAAVIIVAITPLSVVPTWFRWATFSIALVLALTSVMVVTMILLPIWVGIATNRLSRTAVSTSQAAAMCIRTVTLRLRHPEQYRFA